MDLKCLVATCFALILGSTITFADVKCSKNGTKIIFINGVDVDKAEGALHASNFVRIIEKEIGYSRIDKNSNVDVGFRHNRDVTRAIDYIEAGAQGLNSRFPSITPETAFVLIYNILTGAQFIAPPLPGFNWFEELKINEIEEFKRITQEDIRILKEDIVSSLVLDKKIILVSHSQGNFFVTSALNELDGTQEIRNGKMFRFNNYKKFIGNLRVASPQDVELAHSVRTVLNDQDFLHANIIIRNLANTPPPTFVLMKPEEPLDLRDESDRENNHGFSSTYLFRINDLDGYLFQKYSDPAQRSYVRAQHLSLDSLGKQTLDRLVEVANGLDSNCTENCIEVKSASSFQAIRHNNPDGSEGGLVSVEAFVAPTVTVDPDAVVCGRAHVLDNVKIYDSARVDGSALITKNAVIANKAYITGNSFVTDDARVAGESLLEGSPIVAGFAVISGTSSLNDEPLVDGSASVENSILIENSSVVDEAILMNNAFLVSAAIVADKGKIDGGIYISETSLVAGNASIKGLTLVVGNALVLGGNITSAATESMFERLNIPVDTIILDSPTINGIPSFATNTLVRGNASILENAIIGNGSTVSDEATVRGSVYIQDTVVANRAQVSGNVNSYSGYILDDAVVRDFVSISQGKIYESASVFGSALIFGRVHGNAQVGGTTVVGADESVN